MYHLRLIKGLSYTGAVSASKEHPDVFTPDPEKYSKAMKSGYFENLKSYASLNGINLGSAKKKDDIIQKIEEAEDHAAEVRDSLR